MDPFSGIFPAQREVSIYRCLRLLGALGITEAILGVVIVAVEITALTTLKEAPPDIRLFLRENLPVSGISVGICVVIVGIWGRLTQLSLVQPRARHCMFLLGMLLTSLCFWLSLCMLLYTLKDWKELKKPDSVLSTITKNGTATVHSVDMFNLAEFKRTLIPMDMAKSAIYALLTLGFLASFLLNCKNIRRIMKFGGGCIPHYSLTWMPSSMRKHFQPRNRKQPLSRRKTPEETVIMDKHGSMTIIPPEGLDEEIQAGNGKISFQINPPSRP